MAWPERQIDMTQSRGGPAAGRAVLPRPVRARFADDAQLRRRRDHRREGAQELRNAAGQPAAAGGHRAGQAAGLALLTSAMLVVSSLPIVMLCLPLGGVSFYEVLAAYWRCCCRSLTSA